MSAVVETAARAAPQRGLAALNPLAKIAGPGPAMIALVFVRDLSTPLVFLGLAYVVLLFGTRLAPRAFGILIGVIPVAIAVVAAGFALWVDPARVEGSPELVRIGAVVVTAGAVEVGLATGLRLAAIMALAFIGGLTTEGADLVRALVQQLRVPYRIGYAGLAAIRFVPRFGHELAVIRQAHRVRGARGGALSAPERVAGYIVPLLAGGIRHAERVALAMDARAFGAHPDRTERHLVPWRRRDTVFVGVFWVVSIVVFAIVRPF